MKFLNKFKLGFGITTLVMGAGLTALAGGLVGSGVNLQTFKTYEPETESNGQLKDGIDTSISVGFGVGNLNFGEISVQYVKDDAIISADKAGAAAVTKANALIAEFKAILTSNGLTDTATKSEFIKAAESTNKAEKQKIKDQYSSQTPNKDAIEASQAIIASNNVLLNGINSADAMMLSGSILLPIFIIVMGFGIAVTTVAALNKKKAVQVSE